MVRVDRGWSLRPAESNPTQGYLLHRGAATVSIAYVSLTSRSQAPRLWDGLRAILRLRSPALKIGAPTVITSRQGRAGLTGAVASRSTAGAATIFVGPSGTFAIQLLVLVPRNARGAAALAAAGKLVRSVVFPAAPR